jgi:hypothetical protein
MPIAGTWCSVADVNDFLGLTVTATDVNAAQIILEGVVRRVWRATDTERRDYYWLQRACIWQAAYVHQHPEILTMMGMQSMSQDGMSLSMPPGGKAYLAPLALLELNNLFRGSNTTIRLNSAFQRNRVRQGQVPGGSMPWRRME